MTRPGLSKEVTSELSPEDRSHLKAGRRASAEALENKLRLFGEQTEGPVCLEYREREGGQGGNQRGPLKTRGGVWIFILSAMRSHRKVLNRSAVPAI